MQKRGGKTAFFKGVAKCNHAEKDGNSLDIFLSIPIQASSEFGGNPSQLLENFPKAGAYKRS
jgi:hypothetical protein